MGGRALGFHFGIVCGQKGQTEGLVNGHCWIWYPCELNFLKCSLVKWSLAHFGTSELNSSVLILKLWRLKILKDCHLWGESRVLRTEKCWNGGLANSEEDVKRGFQGRTYPFPIFQGAPPHRTSHSILANLLEALPSNIPRVCLVLGA